MTKRALNKSFMIGDVMMAKTGKKPAVGKQAEEKRPQKARLTLHDRETGESRFCSLDEARTWDWKNPEIWRMIGDMQISSYERLLEVLSFKIENGAKEIEIVEAPRFMMLSGG